MALTERKSGLFSLGDIPPTQRAFVAVALVAEAGLAAWFGLAGGAGERITAGVLFVLLLLAILGCLAVTHLMSGRGAIPGIDTAGLREGATSERIDAARPEEIAAPDGSYLIERPPSSWTIDDGELADITKAENRLRFGVDFNPLMAGAVLPTAGRVLQFKADNAVVAKPIVGRTKEFGRAGPIFLSHEIRSELAIVPMARAQPPAFTEIPFLQNVLRWVVTPVQFGEVVDRIDTRSLERAENPIIAFTFVATLEDLLVDGKPATTCRRTRRLIGVRGDIYDYMLLVTDYSYETSTTSYPGERETFDRLIASFRPLRVQNRAAKLAEQRRLADAAFQQMLATQAETAFRLQLQIALGRIAAEALGGISGAAKAVELLEPFRQYATNGGLGSSPLKDQLAPLWDAVEQASAGNAAPLQAQLRAIFAPQQQTPSGPPAGDGS